MFMTPMPPTMSEMLPTAQQGEDAHLRLHAGDQLLCGDDAEFEAGRAALEIGADIGHRRLVRDAGLRAGDDDIDPGVGDDAARGRDRHEDGPVRLHLEGRSSPPCAPAPAPGENPERAVNGRQHFK